MKWRRAPSPAPSVSAEATTWRPMDVVETESLRRCFRCALLRQQLRRSLVGKARKTWRAAVWPPSFFGVPSMTNSLEVQVLYPARWRRRISEAQGRRREAGSEGSVEQSRDPMDKNRIRGLPGRTSEPMIAKSTAIKGRGGKSGGCAVKAVGLTSGGLRRVRKPRTERARKGRHQGPSSRCRSQQRA